MGRQRHGRSDTMSHTEQPDTRVAHDGDRIAFRLEWDDVDLASGTMVVYSPKTEHHPGHEFRTVPMDTVSVTMPDV